jgi:hypothetical protein
LLGEKGYVRGPFGSSLKRCEMNESWGRRVRSSKYQLVLLLNLVQSVITYAVRGESVIVEKNSLLIENR